MVTPDKDRLLKESFASATRMSYPLSCNQKDLARIYKEKMLHYGERHGYTLEGREVDAYIGKQFNLINALNGNAQWPYDTKF